MAEHLTPEQFEDYCRRRLRVAELVSVSEHIGGCEACRRQVEVASNGDAAFFALRSELFGDAAEFASPQMGRAHLTAEQASAYVEGTLTGEGLQSASDHLSRCEHCALSVEDLRAFGGQAAPSLSREYQPAAAPSPSEGGWRRAFGALKSGFRASPWPAFGAAAVVILLAASGWLIWRAQLERGPRQEVAVAPSTQPAPAAVSTTPSQPDPAPSQTEQAAQPEPAAAQPEQAAAVARLNDGGGLLTLDREGRLSGADALPPAYRELLKGALAGRRIERSPQLRGLARPGSSLMSSETSAGEFSVLGPVGSVLINDRPTFRWSPLEGATGYVVEVYDDGFNLVAASPQLAAPSWTAPQTLPRGRVYSWQVKAVRDGQVAAPARAAGQVPRPRPREGRRVGEGEEGLRLFAPDAGPSVAGAHVRPRGRAGRGDGRGAGRHPQQPPRA